MMLILVLILILFSTGLSESHNRTTCTGQNYYDEVTDICLECPITCPAGYGYLKEKCGNGEMKSKRCNLCEAGSTFSSADDAQRCQYCNMCLHRQVLANCTTTSNTVCGSCHDGYGWDNFRKVCKLCKSARKVLPGCETPPNVTLSKMQNLRVVCAVDSTADKYSWLKNGEILDTSDETKFHVVGKTLIIYEPDFDGEMYYECRAEWNTNKNHNFDIMKMSSNKAEVSSIKQDEKTTCMNYTIQEEVSTDIEAEYVPDKQTTTTRNVDHCSMKHNCFKTWKFWLLTFAFCVVFLVVFTIIASLFIPTTSVEKVFGWVREKVNLRNICRGKAYQVENEPSRLYPDPESESHKLTEVLIDTSQSSATSGLLKKQSKENVGSLYQTALECCEGLFYKDLSINTTDRLGVLLNPCPDPKPPVKFWKHLAEELGFKDKAVLNHLGSYQHFHSVLLTRNIPMKDFLEALEKVGNAEATEVLCEAVIIMQR